MKNLNNKQISGILLLVLAAGTRINVDIIADITNIILPVVLLVSGIMLLVMK